EHVSAELKVKAVSGDTSHAEKQNQRNESDEDVGDDQAVSQAPEHLRPNDWYDPDQQVDDGEKRGEENAVGVRQVDLQEMKDALNCAEQDERDRDLVERGGPAKKDGNT